jgi:serpin B
MLRETGLSLPFDALRADFGEMTVGLPPEPIYASEVYHTSDSSRSTRKGPRPPRLPPEDFVADHPFMFLIKRSSAAWRCSPGK